MSVYRGDMQRGNNGGFARQYDKQDMRPRSMRLVETGEGKKENNGRPSEIEPRLNKPGNPIASEWEYYKSRLLVDVGASLPVRRRWDPVVLLHYWTMQMYIVRRMAGIRIWLDRATNRQ